MKKKNKSTKNRAVVYYLQYTNPAAYPPLENSSEIFAKSGLFVLHFGVRISGVEQFVMPENDNVKCQYLSDVKSKRYRKVHYLKFCIVAVIKILMCRPRYVYLSDSITAPIGLFLARIGFKVIYHEHDSPNGEGNSLYIKWILRCRNKLSNMSCINILPQEDRSKIFIEETKTIKPVFTIWNCPSRKYVESSIPSFRKPRDPLRIYFHGSINLSRVPLSLIEAAKLLGVPVNIKIVGYETEGSRGACEKLRAALGDANSLVDLDFPGSFAHHELIAQMRGMTLGWLCYKNESHDVNLNYLAGASNKAFEYLAAGLPIIVPDYEDWERIFVRNGCGLSCDPYSVKSVSSTLKWFYDNPSSAAQMGERGRSRILSDWNYESQFRVVQKALKIY